MQSPRKSSYSGCDNYYTPFIENIQTSGQEKDKAYGRDFYIVRVWAICDPYLGGGGTQLALFLWECLGAHSGIQGVGETIKGNSVSSCSKQSPRASFNSPPPPRGEMLSLGWFLLFSFSPRGGPRPRSSPVTEASDTGVTQSLFSWLTS